MRLAPSPEASALRLSEIGAPVVLMLPRLAPEGVTRAGAHWPRTPPTSGPEPSGPSRLTPTAVADGGHGAEVMSCARVNASPDVGEKVTVPRTAADAGDAAPMAAPPSTTD